MRPDPPGSGRGHGRLARHGSHRSGDPDFLVVGDLNSYAQEDTIDEIKAGSATAGPIEQRLHQPDRPDPGACAYSYTFDGRAGSLDHALHEQEPSSGQVKAAADWHINSDKRDMLDYDTELDHPARDAL